MNSNDLFDIIGQTPDRYVLDAVNTQKSNSKALPPKRIWLIAAIVALILCLVGCAIVYALRLQDMKVGEYNFYVPPAYDEDGNLIPVEIHAPITQISLQGANKDALAEWLAFTNAYDPDLEIAGQADQAMKAGNPWDIPENYHLTYGCYSQDMVDKLNAIKKKYDLKLLSAYIPCEHYEGDVILGALGLDGLIEPGKFVDVAYGGGYFFPEGTFKIDMSISLDAVDWKWENAYGSYRYSVKEYFDPAVGGIDGTEEYTQWNYTRKDGLTVLLVLNEKTARIYADLPDAFVSIYVDPVTMVAGKEVPLTESALEQLSELFSFSINPTSVNMEQVEQLKAKALADYEAERALLVEERESKYAEGYKEFVEYRLETTHRPENLVYALFDVNGDGTDEMIIQFNDILSMKDGKSYKYFDLMSAGIGGGFFAPCENNTFELYNDLFANHRYYFYKAGPEGATFITGLIYDANEDSWYRSLDGGSFDTNREPITAEEAQRIRDSYRRIEVEMLPLINFGQEAANVDYEDLYAKYIASKLNRSPNAGNYEYALYDVNGDGVIELITRDVEVHTMGETFYLLSIHSIRDGKLWNMGIDRFTYVCEGGILEDSEDFVDRGNGGAYHYFYRCTENGVEPVEKIVRDPITLYWGHALAGQDGKTVTEEKAKSILASYKRLDLDWKPFAEYPLS